MQIFPGVLKLHERVKKVNYLSKQALSGLSGFSMARCQIAVTAYEG
jgi:hypothetical protein